MGFLGDTLVSNGCNYTSIETLTDRNQPFLSGTFTEEYQLFTAAKTTAVREKQKETIFQIIYTVHQTLQNLHHVIYCSPEQHFLVAIPEKSIKHEVTPKELRWIPAKKLKPGMEFLSNEQFITIASIENLDLPAEVYTCLMPYTDNFMIADGIIAKTEKP